MLELFMSEWRRFRKGALMLAAVHLLALLVLDGLLGDFFNAPLMIQGMALTAYLVIVLLFALYQFVTLRKPARWIWLLHRPLTSRRLFLALAGAAGCAMALAIAVPLLSLMVTLDLFTARLIEWRHYAMLVHLMLLMVLVWSAGCHIALFRNAAGVAILVPLALLFGRQASLTVLLPLAVACAVPMLWLASGSFRPDRQHDGGSGPFRIAASAPVQIAAYILLAWLASWAYQLGLIMQKSHPNNLETPLRGGYVEASRAHQIMTFRLGLAGVDTPEAAAWRRRFAYFVPIDDVWVMTTARPLRYQWGNSGTPFWTDKEKHVRWTFSHDAMRYAGEDTWTGASRGWLGAARSDPRFDSPPLIFSRNAGRMSDLQTSRRLYQFDAAGQTVHPAVSVAGDESLVYTSSPGSKRNTEYVLTSRRLMIFDVPAARSNPWHLRASIPLPGALYERPRIRVANTSGGTLVSMVFGAATAAGGPDGRQTLHEVDPQGTVRLVARRTLKHEFPLLFEHLDWWLSPALYQSLQLREHWLDNGDAEAPPWTPRPPAAWLAAALAALVSAAAAWLWMGRTALSPRRRAAWLAACLVLGPPSLLALMTLHRRTAKAARPAGAALPAAA